MAKKKFYAVSVGREPGIYRTWEDCQKQTDGFPGAQYKSFKNIEDAKEYLESKPEDIQNLPSNNDENFEQMIKDDLKNNYIVAFTDGSHNSDTNESSYGLHITIPNGDFSPKIEEISSKVYTKKFSESNNIVGEVFGVINAFDWCLKNEIEKISIYCDYEGLIEWAEGSWKARSSIAKFYLERLEKYKVMLDIKFTWVKGHSNIPQNEKADTLAKNALSGKRQKFKTGSNFFTGVVNNVHEIDNIISLIDEELEIETLDNKVNNGIKKTILFEKEKLHVTFYNKNSQMLVQGAPGYLYTMFLSHYSESLEAFDMVKTYSDAYESTIKNEFVESSFNKLNLPDNYPESYKTLIRQAISTLKIKNRKEYDYGHYTVPAYRALEGNLRYLFEDAGCHVENRFSIGGHFGKDKHGQFYLKTKKLKAHRNKEAIENCYNHYYNERHPLLHTNEIGIADDTRLITSLQDAKDEIEEVLALLKF